MASRCRDMDDHLTYDDIGSLEKIGNSHGSFYMGHECSHK